MCLCSCFHVFATKEEWSFLCNPQCVVDSVTMYLNPQPKLYQYASKPLQKSRDPMRMKGSACKRVMKRAAASAMFTRRKGSQLTRRCHANSKYMAFLFSAKNSCSRNPSYTGYYILSRRLSPVSHGRDMNNHNQIVLTISMPCSTRRGHRLVIL